MMKIQKADKCSFAETEADSEQMLMDSRSASLLPNQMLPAVPSVAIVFGSRSRHIFFNGELLCETKHKSAAGGYSHGHYCSYSLDSSDFKKERTEPDVDYKRGGGCHSTGLIPFKPLNEIEPKIIERSICRKCLSKYNCELSRYGR